MKPCSEHHILSSIQKIKPILFLNSQLGREREERNYYQLERDRLSTFWDVAQKQLDESRAECRVKGTIHLIFFRCTIVRSYDSTTVRRNSDLFTDLLTNDSNLDHFRLVESFIQRKSRNFVVRWCDGRKLNGLG